MENDKYMLELNGLGEDNDLKATNAHALSVNGIVFIRADYVKQMLSDWETITTSNGQQCNIPHVGSHRELLLAFLKSFESHDIELIKMGEYDEVIDGFLASN